MEPCGGPAIGTGGIQGTGLVRKQEDFAARCADLYKRHDMTFIAGLLGVAPVEVSRTLRQARIATDVQPFELSFIVGKIGAMPDRAISEHLGLSASQLDQILRRHNIRKELKAERMTPETCIARTRWLVEERLGLSIDDQLPRLITSTHFTKHGLYPVVALATVNKAKCPTARHFSACAFLIGEAYPGRFKPWQFRHSKQNHFFSGKYGRKNFLDALLWLTETKMGVTRETLPYVMGNHSFLNVRTLQDYGLGAHWWRPLWPGKGEMLEALAKAAGVVPAGHGDQRTARARTQLRAAGIDPARCAVPGCPVVGSDEIHIHHIVPKATRVTGRFDLHAVENLVPLCRHHHGAADRVQLPASALRSPAALRPWLLEKLTAMAGLSDRGGEVVPALQAV